MGLPIKKMIAAVNSNRTFFEFIKNSDFKPRATIRTYSNAMDVGNPNNFHRISDLFKNDTGSLRGLIDSRTYTDPDTLEGISEVSQKYNYTIDPHGAIGYLALRDYLIETVHNDTSGIILETAHPAKFVDVVNKAIDKSIETPERLSRCFNKEMRKIHASKNYFDIREIILSIS